MIKYDPTELLRLIAPKSKIKKLVKGNLSLKRTALSFVNDIDFLSKNSVAEVALKVLKSYRERSKEDPNLESKLKKDPAQLIQRVQNHVVTEIAGEIKSQYLGEKYRWLPSDAEEPDPEHQLNYGKVFTVGDGEMPGDRYGCRCGMEILTDDTKLDL